jgi:hypothetical protein
MNKINGVAHVVACRREEEQGKVNGINGVARLCRMFGFSMYGKSGVGSGVVKILKI